MDESIVFKANRKLYASVILLLALNKAHKHTTREKSHDLQHGSNLFTPEQLFYNFVSRLGQICDSRPGGFKVTACAILQRNDAKVEYVFASNRRSPGELGSLKGYIISILESLRSATTCESEDQEREHFGNLLREILRFNRDRVEYYLKRLKESLDICLDLCEKEDSPQAMTQQTKFRNIRESILGASESDIDEDEFLNRTECLIEVLQAIQNSSSTDRFVWKRASDDKSRNSEPWRELRHYASRIVAYNRAAEILWQSGDTWPDLSVDFEVTCIPSSNRTPNPLMTSPLAASAILTQILPTKDQPQYLGLVDELQQRFKLDEEIKEEWTRKSLKPTVHAELLVLNWLETNGGTRPERFFNNWQCIGSSKPPCKLCHYYISSHPSGVQFRRPHTNLYANWRMPDAADIYTLSSKDEILQKRQEITQKVIDSLRLDIMRALSDKVADTRPHDSATISSLAIHHPQITLGAGMRFGDLSRLHQSGPSDETSQREWFGEESVDNVVGGSEPGEDTDARSEQ